MGHDPRMIGTRRQARCVVATQTADHAPAFGTLSSDDRGERQLKGCNLAISDHCRTRRGWNVDIVDCREGPADVSLA